MYPNFQKHATNMDVWLLLKRFINEETNFGNSSNQDHIHNSYLIPISPRDTSSTTNWGTTFSNNITIIISPICPFNTHWTKMNLPLNIHTCGKNISIIFMTQSFQNQLYNTYRCVQGYFYLLSLKLCLFIMYV